MQILSKVSPRYNLFTFQIIFLWENMRIAFIEANISFIIGLVLRVSGDIQGSFNLLKKCHVMNETNVELLKQLARTLHLLGKHKACLDVVSEAVKFSPEDWEIHYTKGIAYLNLNDFDSAIESFKLANLNNKHEST